MQHFCIFRVGIIFRERVVEVAVHLDNFCAHHTQRIRRKRARSAIATRRNHLDRTTKLRIANDCLDILVPQIIDPEMTAARAGLKLATHDDLFQAAHLNWSEC